jgi:hypothetical protein
MGARLLRARGGWLPACRFFAPALLSAGASSFSLSTAMPEALPGACEYLHWETQPKGKAAADIAPAAPKAPTAAQQAAAAQQARLAKLANAAPAPAPAPPAKADDDEMDLWGDEPLGDDLTAEEQANEERLAAIAAAHKAKKAAAGKLKKVINKSKIVLDVKPWDDEAGLRPGGHWLRNQEAAHHVPGDRRRRFGRRRHCGGDPRFRRLRAVLRHLRL